LSIGLLEPLQWKMRNEMENLRLVSGVTNPAIAG